MESAIEVSTDDYFLEVKNYKHIDDSVRPLTDVGG